MLLISGNHCEEIELFIIPSSSASVIPGFPWLVRHNPQFNWTAGAMTGWSTACHSHCLRSALPPLPECLIDPLAPPDLFLVPKPYHDLRGLLQGPWPRFPSPL